MSPGIPQYDEQDEYQTFLLRLWRARYHGRWSWRASLESPRTGERHTLGTLAGLFTFLEDKTRQETPRSGVDRQEVDRGSVPCVEEERHDV